MQPLLSNLQNSLHETPVPSTQATHQPRPHLNPGHIGGSVSCSRTTPGGYQDRWREGNSSQSNAQQTASPKHNNPIQSMLPECGLRVPTPCYLRSFKPKGSKTGGLWDSGCPGQQHIWGCIDFYFKPIQNSPNWIVTVRTSYRTDPCVTDIEPDTVYGSWFLRLQASVWPWPNQRSSQPSKLSAEASKNIRHTQRVLLTTGVYPGM